MAGSTSTIREVNWQDYAAVFPDRYVRPSKSDKLISEGLDGHPNRASWRRALDVGGGFRGTRYLQGKFPHYRLLDPFVKSFLPQIGWNKVHANSFDVVIARGSINYLNLLQIDQLARCIRPGGLMAFNTFLKPSEGERPYFSRTGSGTERYKFLPDEGPFGMMEHALEPEGENPIVHTFHYYPPDYLEDMFSAEGLSCKVERHGNTGVFFCERPEM